MIVLRNSVVYSLETQWKSIKVLCLSHCTLTKLGWSNLCRKIAKHGPQTIALDRCTINGSLHTLAKAINSNVNIRVLKIRHDKIPKAFLKKLKIACVDVRGCAIQTNPKGLPYVLLTDQYKKFKEYHLGVMAMIVLGIIPEHAAHPLSHIIVGHLANIEYEELLAQLVELKKLC